MKKIYFVIIVIALFLVFGYGCSNSNEEKEITFRVSDGFIQWQYEGETEWNNLITLEELKGEDGLPGKDGKDGLTPFIGENGNWWIGDIDTGVFAGYKNPSVPMTGNFEFAANTDGKSYYVSKYNGNDRLVYIPDQFNGYPVTSIGSNAFYNNSAIEKIIVPKTIETIYSSAFSGVENLREIEFEEDSNLISIGENALLGCKNLLNISIPNSVTSIGHSAFENCSSLTSITIPNSVTSIGSRAFSGCSSLTSIVIPDSVTSIGSSSFSGCSKLESMTLPFVGESSTATSASPSTLFGYIFGTSSYTGGVETEQYYSGYFSATYYIPTTLNTVIITGGNILYGAFYNCSSLTSIVIPDSITTIGDYSFFGCRSLIYNEYDNGLYLGNKHNPYLALVDVKRTNISTCIINNSTRFIMTSAFSGCSSLTSITIPDSVTSIGHSAFENCSSLTSITIPNSVTSIGSRAFSGCSSLTSIVIPDSVTSIGSSSFSGCSKLESMTLPFVGESSTATSASFSTLFGYIFGTSSYTGGVKTEQYYSTIYSPATYYIPTTLNTVIITGGNILYGAFYNCSSLTSIVIPDSITTIGDYSFFGCSSLTSIIIPDSVTSIGNEAFYGCSSLTSITIPNSVTSIGSSAFSGCSSLTSITIPNSVTSIGSSAFSGCSSLTSIIVDSANKVYDSRDNCNGIILTTTNTLIVGCKSTVIPNSVTSIGIYAFYGCSSLTSIEIPNTVTSIGIYAFYGCSSLTSIIIPDSVTSIGDYAFYGCSSITSITIPNSVTSIGSYAFRNCSSLTSITIPNSVTSIGSSAFGGCSSLTSITIPDSVTSIGSSAFSGCSSLTSITIPDSVTSIASYAFYGCISLTSISIPDSVTSIGNEAFSGCSSLTSIIIPDGVTSIGNSAFRGCSSLTSIIIPNSVTSIGSYAFSNCSKLTIYVEALSKPSGWDSTWNYSIRPVVWGYNG